jgi:hypothetical protein
MIKVKEFINNKWVYITLQELCYKYDKEAPKGWFQEIEEIVDSAMNIKTQKEYEDYFNKYSFRKFDNNELKKFYEVLKKSKYSKMFDDDILKYIAYIRECHFFDMINYDLNKDNPDLDKWLNTKCPFCSEYARAQSKEDEIYSIMDLLPLVNGMNAIRSQMLKANKWIY